jgi:hypothetical protein
VLARAASGDARAASPPFPGLALPLDAVFAPDV